MSIIGLIFVIALLAWALKPQRVDAIKWKGGMSKWQ